MGIRFEGKDYYDENNEQFFPDGPGPGFRRAVRIVAHPMGAGGVITEEVEALVPGWQTSSGQDTWYRFGSQHRNILSDGQVATLPSGRIAEGI